MPMPPQLARAQRPRRTAPRPLVEQLPRIEIADLCRLGGIPKAKQLARSLFTRTTVSVSVPKKHGHFAASY